MSTNTGGCINGQINVVLMVRGRIWYSRTYRWHSTFYNFTWKPPAAACGWQLIWNCAYRKCAVYVWFKLWRFTTLPFDRMERKFAFRARISCTRIGVRRSNDTGIIVGARLKNFNGERFPSRYEFIVYFYPKNGVSPQIRYINIEKSERTITSFAPAKK